MVVGKPHQVWWLNRDTIPTDHILVQKNSLFFHSHPNLNCVCVHDKRIRSSQQPLFCFFFTRYSFFIKISYISILLHRKQAGSAIHYFTIFNPLALKLTEITEPIVWHSKCSSPSHWCLEQDNIWVDYSVCKQTYMRDWKKVPGCTSLCMLRQKTNSSFWKLWNNSSQSSTVEGILCIESLPPGGARAFTFTILLHLLYPLFIFRQLLGLLWALELKKRLGSLS